MRNNRFTNFLRYLKNGTKHRIKLFLFGDKHKDFFNELLSQYGDVAKKWSNLPVSEERKKCIWIFWWDGYEKMPSLCKKCFESVLKYKRNDYKIIFIDKNNYSKYVNLPNYIIDKHNSGIISHTHFSDILRVSLLTEHGGVWMDSTVLLTSEIPDYVYDTPLFLFKGSKFENISCGEKGSNISSWFISSNKRHPLLIAVKEMLLLYWEENNELKEFFLFHWLFTIAAKNNIKLWNDIVYYPNVMPHYLYFSIFGQEYDEQKYSRAKELSFCHKLSRHRSPIVGSFHEMLINNKICL